MNKRGSETAINPLITIALGVVVLIILIVIFRDQITKGSTSYTDISKQATLDATSCSFVRGLSCKSDCDTSTEKEITEAKPSCLKINADKTQVQLLCCGSKTA
jgi:hypothetical protein